MWRATLTTCTTIVNPTNTKLNATSTSSTVTGAAASVVSFAIDFSAVISGPKAVAAHRTGAIVVSASMVFFQMPCPAAVHACVHMHMHQAR